MRIGIVGAGLLGTAVGLNLLRKGHSLTVYNRTRSKTAPLQKEGAKIVESPKKVSENSDIVFSIVKNADAVKKVAFGDECIACGKHDGLIVCDMSTINPISSKEIAKEFSNRGIPFLDTPVMGGPNVAITGELVMMVGGQKEIFEKCKPVFDDIANKVFHLGPNSSAHSVKIAMNLQIALLALAISEGITLARGANIDPEIFLKVLNSTYFKTGMSENKAYKMLKGDYNPTFTLSNLKKDLDTINEAAKSYGLSLPMATRANQVYKDAEDKGFGELDYTAILDYLNKSSK
ncbi:MAG: NAD(P)-dependent oxidoreductase [Nitrososphaeria archaeon]|nr:NAD(P)-dependent oxidoreductase [Nitrososphaeria archaeon]NDB50770.1 NAD(P)-dependent oxidoreductase [Nitrosopumilaceae archaeon]NDB87485.1 NAD(P)-dependent oxidoreductase [Nitrososphaerota archaeon]NDB89423.1 NAD(P)-dependent oxidoreductase [Nitrososphaerota archaeon]NDB92293.1 NAD(P)-dependent oxidoreductase [Nitrososphaeria archaeon]